MRKPLVSVELWVVVAPSPYPEPERRLAKPHADKGYDFPRCRATCRGIESRERLGRRRWVVGRTLAWPNRFC